jgi:hypothetical protein
VDAVKMRIVAVAAAGTLAVSGLAGCRTNVGTAATVDGRRISESTVSSYLTPEGPDKSASQNGQAVSARSQILQVLVQEKVFEKTLESIRANQSLPTESQLTALHDQAASVLLQTNLTGGALDKALRQGLPRSGIKASFAKSYLRVQELEFAIIKAKRLSRLPELLALIKKAHVAVSVSPRYGTWDTKNLAVNAKGSIPSYLSIQPGSGTPAPAVPTQPTG